MQGKTIDELNTGDHAEVTKTLSESDIYLFAGITGDFNPAHIDEEYARKTFFKRRIAHGMLTASFISTVIGTRLPGPGTIYLSQDLKFLAPAHAGDTLTARVEVVEINREKKRVKLATSTTNQDGTVIVQGEAWVSPPKAKGG